MFELFTYIDTFAVSITLLCAYLLDYFLGEAKRFHYLVGFGWLATKLEEKLNHLPLKKQQHINTFSLKQAVLGGGACLLLVLPLPVFYFYISQYLPWYITLLLDVIVLYLAFALNSLQKHATQILTPLLNHNLPLARHFTSYIVSRHTAQLNEDEIARATVESVLENGHDAVIASLVYYLIGGAPLVILHRLTNTLDAMWGYKNQQYYSFGYVAAKLDDILGFISGKVCTLLYAIQGPFLLALKHAYIQGKLYKSHNGGWVMAAGATVMQVTLGGNSIYHGVTKRSPILGVGPPTSADDIARSLTLVKNACYILCSLAVGYQSIHFIFTLIVG